jgi:predicted O-methyltransferase YrrM
MNPLGILRRIAGNSDRSVGLLERAVAGIENETRLLNQRLSELVAGLDNQSRLLNDKLTQLVEGVDHQSSLLNAKLTELIEGVDNQSGLLNDKLTAIIGDQAGFLGQKKAEITRLRSALSAPGRRNESPPSSAAGPLNVVSEKEKPSRPPLADALSKLPLMIDARTFNTEHPDYDARLVRNFPGKIFNAHKPCTNVIYAELKALAKSSEVPDDIWGPLLNDALEEAMTVPHANEVFERRSYIESYLHDITQKYHAHYAAGWVNLEDALFLYWLVRKLKPTTIVQTGVCNGLSSAFMMLGLVKNGPEGRLHAIDLPPVFNPADQAWTVKDKVYGVVIPEGMSSGWMIPDAYRDRFEVWTGGARALLPKMVDKVDAIDLFYHDSDHTYGHMMFEFREAKRKLRPGGVIVADDVSWNASVWDFADQHGVPSYNFKGAVGVACF